MRRAFYHLGLIGYPLGHSRSPQLHHAALAACGMEGSYRLYPIEPGEAGRAEIAGLMQQLRAGKLHGLNVTIPHKQAVMPFVDRLSEVAQAVGAVNTLYLDAGGSLVGENTDVPGFLRDARRLTGERVGQALVMGAGGSARAVVYALASAGWQVTVLARRAEQAEEITAVIGKTPGLKERLRAGGLTIDALGRASGGCQLVVNTTPVGMHPHGEGCPWPDELPLPPLAAVYDLVYNPMETVLVKRARQQGLPAETGARMLADQAALSFSMWTGVEPPFEVMEQAFYAG